MKTGKNKGFSALLHAMGQSVGVKTPMRLKITNKINGFVHIFYWSAVKWSHKPGSYRIYLDSLGFHVHSDAPALGEPFSIATLNLHQLIRKRVGNGEDLEYEYFVEEKSGKRHQISVTLANSNLNVMDLFERVACEFPSVKIVNE